MKRKKGKESLRRAVARLDKPLWHQLEVIWRLAQAGIHDHQRSKDGHQQGTPHCHAVEQNLAALISDDWKGTRLTALDLFVLSAAAALHDIGKASDSPDDHGHVSMWEVRDRAMAFGLDQGQAEVVGWIVRAHNDGNLDALPPDPVPLGAVDVDLRPLAALFKLADTLHTDYCRVSPQVVEFGGRQAEDNPKTRFRLRVRGWRFDDYNRIELYIVPKDWDDLAAIHTGFEMICWELELVVLTLKNADLPWELCLYLDDTDLERRARSEFEAVTAEQAFIGMNYFSEADADRFRGRDLDAQLLWRRVMAMPITLLVGDSGVGKTSLIHAGLFPILHQANWRTAYTRPLDEPDRFILRDLWRELPELMGEAPVGVTILEALGRACSIQSACKLLVVLDQFEDVLRTPLSNMLTGLLRALVATLAGRFRNLRFLICYRSDAEAQVGPFFQDLTGSSRGLPRVYLQPLSKTGACVALATGFAAAHVQVSDSLLDNITRDLENQTAANAIYPPYVQMVGETLCKLAHAQTEISVTEESYRAKGGCEAIIGQYLFQQLAEFGEREKVVRRVLIALVSSTGSRGQKSLEELIIETGLENSVLVPLLDELVRKRMVRKLDGWQYEIIHDHLAGLINHEFVESRERQLKQLRELLDLKARAYPISHVPLESADMTRLYAAREGISPTDEQLPLLLHTCLLERGPAWFWLRNIQEPRLVSLLQGALASPIVPLRRRAVAALVQILGRDAIPSVRDVLEDQNAEFRRTAVEAFIRVAERQEMPDLRKLLKDEDMEVRRQAVQSLAHVGAHEVVPELRLMLKDPRGEVRLAALRALAQIAGAASLPDLRLMLRDPRGEVRVATVRALVQVGGCEVIPDLQLMLKDHRPEVRLATIRALVQVGGSEVVPDLQSTRRDESKEVRRAGVRAIARLTGQHWHPYFEYRPLVETALREATEGSDTSALLGLLKSHKSGNVRGEILRALAIMAGPSAIPHIRQSLEEHSYYVRAVAVELLLPAVERQDIPGLLTFLRERKPDRIARQAAMKAFARVASRREIPDLCELLKDQDKEIRQLATKTLVQVVEEDDISDLRLLSKQQHPYIRGAAAEALGDVARRDAVPDLRELLEDESPYVRQIAARILAEMTGQEGIQDMLELLKDHSSYVRRTAAQALIQVAGADAVLPMEDLIGDQCPSVRQAVAKALGQSIGKTAMPYLQELVKDPCLNVRQAAAQEMEKLLTEDDLPQLAAWIERYPMDKASELTNRILIRLDRRFYCPF